ncbi:MAG: C40 family peptidase [Spirochaetaceae bacterium]|jgi:cell wall-associated NlpC family hydrolase|nr:C40 family peptidase [Spirochaetaceae bacterium]
MRLKKISCLFVVCVLCAGTSNAQTIRELILETAKQYRGTPYRYGGTTPDGFDCSGFVSFVYQKAAGIAIPHSSKGLWNSGKALQLEQAEPGDIIAFADHGVISHVAILFDTDHIIHAVSAGPRRGVIVSPLADRYFGPRIIGARSYLKEALKELP